jgi:hypothetical protein
VRHYQVCPFLKKYYDKKLESNFEVLGESKLSRREEKERRMERGWRKVVIKGSDCEA